MKPRVLCARIPADLINKVYAAEGWTKIEGEARTRRVKTLYDLARVGDTYTATKRP